MFLATRLRAGAPQIMLTLIVFALASGILGGLIFYVDNTTPQIYNEVTSDVPVDVRIDATYALDSSNLTIYDIQAMVASMDLVNKTSVVYYIDIWQSSSDDPYVGSSYIVTYMGIDNNFLSAFPKAFDYLPDNGALLANSCWVSNAELSRLGLEIGDNYTYHNEYWNGSGIEEINYNLKIVGSFSSELFKDYWRWDAPPTSTLGVVMDNVTIQKIFSDSNEYFGSLSKSVWASLDKNTILESDPTEIDTMLGSFETRVEQAILPYASIGWSGFELRAALSQYITWAAAMRLVSITFSVPTILMGIMLVYYDATLNADEIRRDSGTLKTRGASGKQVFTWIMTRAATIAIIGAVGAIATGAGAAILAGTVRTFLEFDLTRLAAITFYLNPSSIIAAFVFSFMLGLFVSIPIAYRSLIQTIAESHQILERPVLLGQEFMKPPVAELLLFAVSIYCISPLLLISTFAMYSSSSFFSLMLIMAPMILIIIVAGVGLASRPTSSIKGHILGKLQHRSFTVSMSVLAKSVRLHKKTEATAVMFIAMVFAASTLATVSATTGYNHMESLFRFDVGADISLDVSRTATNITLDLLDAMRNITGVVEATGLVKVMGNALYQESDYSGFRNNVNESISVWGVDPKSWTHTAFLLPYFTLIHDPVDAFNMLTQDNTSIITSFRPIHHYEQQQYNFKVPVYSNQMTIQLRHTNKTLHMTNSSECTIIDVLADDSGQVTYFPGYPSVTRFVMMNLDYVVAITNKTQVEKFYVALEPNANITQVKHDLIALSPSGFSKISVVQEYIDDALESRAGQVVYGIYTLDVLFVMIFLGVGSVIVTTLRTRKLRRSFSILRALGAEPSPMNASLMIDTSLTLVIALLIGSAIGLFLSWAYRNMQLVYTGVNSTLDWSRLPIELVIPMALIGGIIIFAFVVSLIANYMVNRHSLNRNIAEEIQYSE